MDLNFDTLLDMEPRTPTRPSTPTKICSQLQQLAKEVDQYSTFVRGQQYTIDALKASGNYDLDNPYVKELLNRLYEFTDLHHQAETAENNLTTDSASTTIPNIIKAPLPKENTLNAPTLNHNTLNAPTPNYVPPPIMLKTLSKIYACLIFIFDEFISFIMISWIDQKIILFFYMEYLVQRNNHLPEPVTDTSSNATFIQDL
ncbi:hypothetical protein TNIN_96361 [Trichonephila inaurata madagascariensis]|uniref:Uncharacterized protein n=1 Tax=Trichonephila inaurata madagascariensis TaxID=2747483 RepID=A0A8X6MKL2_9ARAC|nr:hypothetical protein TNIN_96361 [Trichonephila inaurata madagascariensis]